VLARKAASYLSRSDIWQGSYMGLERGIGVFDAQCDKVRSRPSSNFE